jgi:hypothetical protein
MTLEDTPYRILNDRLPFLLLLHFRQWLSPKLHFRQLNGSKTRIVGKVGMRNLWVLIELAATNCFQSRQRIGSSHKKKPQPLHHWNSANNV